MLIVQTIDSSNIMQIAWCKCYAIKLVRSRGWQWAGLKRAFRRFRLYLASVSLPAGRIDIRIAAIAMFVFGLSVYAGHGKADAAVIFSDGFEYLDSPLNHGWTITPNSSTAVTTTEQAHTGQRSLKLTRDPLLPRTGLLFSQKFNNIDISNYAEISVFYFDDLHGGVNNEKEFQVIFDTFPSNDRLATIRPFGRPNYNLLLQTEDGTLHNQDTSVPRQLGFRKFSFIIEGGFLDAYIDNQKIFDNAFPVTKLNEIRLNLGEPVVGIFDDITVIIIPEPKIFFSFILVITLIFSIKYLRIRKHTTYCKQKIFLTESKYLYHIKF